MSELATKQQMEVLFQKFERLEQQISELKDKDKPLYISCKKYAMNTGSDVSSVARL